MLRGAFPQSRTEHVTAMKVETQELPDSEVSLSFEVEDARLERAIDSASRRMAGRVKIDGFRLGKAPRALVERVVGRESLIEEALNSLLPEVYEEALRETNVQALTEPVFDVETITPLKAKATVVVPPHVELGDYRTIRHNLPEVSVDDEELNAVLHQLQESHAEWVPVSRPAGIGDRIAMDVTGTRDGKQVLADEDVEYELRAESPVPVRGFAEALVGIGVDETRAFELEDTNVPAPEEGETAPPPAMIAFEVTCHDVKGKELPGVDDSFAATVGSFADLDALKTEIRGQIQVRAEQKARSTLENEVIDEVVDGSKVEIPEKLATLDAQRMQDRLARDLDSRGLTIEQYLRILRVTQEEIDQRYLEESRRALRRGFVLQAVADHEKIEVTDEEVTSSVRAALEADRADNRTIKRALRQTEILDRARTALVEQRATDWLVREATSDAQVAEADPQGSSEAHDEVALPEPSQELSDDPPAQTSKEGPE